MRFVSDNAAAAHPKVIEAIVESNRLDTAYDGDSYSAQLDAAFSALFGTEVKALWVTTGTAANCLALAALCPPYGGILCHRDAHIEVDEAGAPGFFTGGAKLILLDGPGAKVTPEAVSATCDRIWDDVHQVQPKALSITNATEYGLVYRAAEVAATASGVTFAPGPSSKISLAPPVKKPGAPASSTSICASRWHRMPP